MPALWKAAHARESVTQVRDHSYVPPWGSSSRNVPLPRNAMLCQNVTLRVNDSHRTIISTLAFIVFMMATRI